MKSRATLLVLACFIPHSQALLKVFDTESRESKLLDGFWKFLPDYSVDQRAGFDGEWWKRCLDDVGETIVMPVPSSYNDVTTSHKLRDHQGWVWYQTEFMLPPSWTGKDRIVLRFESAHYFARVWLNDEDVMSHSIGHLPFEQVVTSQVKNESPGCMHRLTVAVNATLNTTTIPPSAFHYAKNTSEYIFPENYPVIDWQFDFFNYGGIHRSVKLYTTPAKFISDVTIKTEKSTTEYSKWRLNISVQVNSENAEDIAFRVVDKRGKNILSGHMKAGTDRVFEVQNVTAWWPWTMSHNPGYMYTLEVTLVESGDVYRQKFGFRQVSWTNRELLINGKKTYLTGINKHEDSDLRGKGVDRVLIARDFSNQLWLGSNAFRTSHYPYAEEWLEMADQLGVMVIGECPGVGIKSWNMLPETLANHKSSIHQMISRDKNHPCIITWSLANEPDSDADEAADYFREVFRFARTLDDSRPFTFVSCKPFDTDKAFQFSDFLNINRYIGWYQQIGDTDIVTDQVKHYVTNYFKQHNKPVMMQEYGADTIPGLHKLPSTSFTEEYQTEILAAHARAFDQMRHFMVGEFIWNYADFMTQQDVKRVDGNKKGVFTRDRQPKMAAHFLRSRYHQLLNLSQPALFCHDLRCT